MSIVMVRGNSWGRSGMGLHNHGYLRNVLSNLPATSAAELS
jgi:hypothetical protein